MTDFLTVLTSKGPLLTKRWTTAGVQSYDRAKNYTVEQVPVDGVRALSSALQSLADQPRRCVIRGRERAPSNGGDVTRDLDTFVEAPHRWVCIDVDWFSPVLFDPVTEPEGAVWEFITTELGHEFRGITHHWQLSSSAGQPGKEHLLKAHIWFWLSESRQQYELEAWADHLVQAQGHHVVDRTVFRTVQVHYTANPVFEGVKDPVPLRSGLVEGVLGDEVDLDIEGDWFTSAHCSSPEGRRVMKDPGTVPGLIGVFNRLYPPHRLVTELIPHVFEFEGDSETRLTWLQGGGAVGGAVITDDELHIYNSHNTDPLGGRAANSWDVARVHLYGHLDNDLTDFERDDPHLWPSQQRMREWALEIEDVSQEFSRSKKEYRAEAERTEAQTGNEALPAALERIEACENPSELETTIAADLRAQTWTDVQRGQLARAIQQRVLALTEVRLPIATARGWVAPARAGNFAFRDLTESGAPKATLDNVVALVNNLGITVRYNVISKQDEIVIPDTSWTRDNAANSSLMTLYSECVRADMPITTSVLKNYVTAIGDTNQYNPALTWIESCPWDGVDRLPQLYATVKSPNTALKEMLMRKWLLQCVAILHNTGDTMARGVLTFQGAQYQGKTRWLKALAPAELVKTGHALDVHNKDSILSAIRFWLCELGEVDGTFRKSDMALLKSFVSQSDDVLRRPYAVSESEFPRRTSFFATVNESDFLLDPTGSSRFWVIPVTEISPDDALDIQQLWAQVLAIWKTGEVHWLSNAELELLNRSNEDHAIEDPLEDLVNDRFQWDDPLAEEVWMTSGEVARRLGIPKPTRSEAMAIKRQVLRRNGGRKRRTETQRLVMVKVSSDHLLD